MNRKLPKENEITTEEGGDRRDTKKLIERIAANEKTT